VGSLVLGISFGPCYSRRRVASLSESPSRQVPRCPRRRSSPSSGSMTAYSGVLGSPTILLCSSEVRPSALGAAGPCRTIRSVMRG
jgi:hypothetical protein